MQESEVQIAPVGGQADDGITVSTIEQQVETPSEQPVEQTDQPAESDKPLDGEAEPVKKPGNKKQRKIDYLNRALGEKEAEIAALRAKVPQEKPVETASQGRKVDLSEEPNINDYGTQEGAKGDYLDYTRDIAKWEFKQERLAFENERIEADRQKKIEVYNEMTQSIKAEMPDFDEKVGELYNAGLIPPHIEDVVLNQSNSAELAKHFVKYPGDLQELNQYDPKVIPAKIKQIQAWIKEQGNQPQPRQTQAPAPIKPVGNSVNPVEKNPEKMSQEEFERWRYPERYKR